MKILEIEIPEEVMVVFNKWCKLLNYLINEKSLEMFFYDCYLNFCIDTGFNYKSDAKICKSEVSGNIGISYYILFSNPFDMSESIIETMQNKLNEINV